MLKKNCWIKSHLTFLGLGPHSREVGKGQDRVFVQKEQVEMLQKQQSTVTMWDSIIIVTNELVPEANLKVKWGFF